MNKLKMASFFAGVGGIDLGFEQTGMFETIYANEYNPDPVVTYEANFNIKVDCRDIRQVKADELPDFDVMLAGFPCQPFSVAGYQQGFKDKKGRGDLFFELARIVEAKKPQVIFLENVKNLVTHDEHRTFKIILETLESLGYETKAKVLNGMQYGNVPQNRERIYIVAFLDHKLEEKFEFPTQIKLTKYISDCVSNKKLDDKYYYNSDKYPFMKNIDVDSMLNDTIYQWRRIYMRENKSKVCPTLTANMGTGGHNVPLIKTKYGLRKLTPRECFNFQGFPENFKLPEVADGKLYKQAGNSVCVSVIKRIALEMAKAYYEN